MEKAIPNRKYWVLAILLITAVTTVLPIFSYSQATRILWELLCFIGLPLLTVPRPVWHSLGFSGDKILRQVGLGIFWGITTILAFEIIQLMICLFLLPPSQYQWNFSLPILQILPKGIVQIICVQLFYAVTQEILFRGYLQRQLNVFFHSENVRIIFVACFAALCQAVPLLFPESIAMFTDRLHNGTATVGSLAMMAVRDLGGTLLLGLAAGFLTARKKEYTTLSAICTHLIWGYLPAMLFSLNISQ